MSATEQELAEAVEPEQEPTAVEGPPEAVTSEDEMARMDPTPSTYTFESGLEVDIERLRTRQFFKLLRIITHGGMDVLGAVRLDPSMGEKAFTENLIAVIIFAVPEAEDETLEFLRSMVIAKHERLPDNTPPAQAGKVAKEMEANAARRIDAEFMNPGLNDLTGLVEVIIRREAPELKALGKRLSDTLKFNRAAKQGSSTAPSLEDSQEPST
jgi:hypothetical protein